MRSECLPFRLERSLDWELDSLRSVALSALNRHSYAEGRGECGEHEREVGRMKPRPSLSLLARHGADASAEGSNPSGGIRFFAHTKSFNTPRYLG